MISSFAVIPGQVAADDAGLLEITDLRREAEEAPGDDFDMRKFNEFVLQDGVTPLWMLRQGVEAWIAAQTVER